MHSESNRGESNRSVSESRSDCLIGQPIARVTFLRVTCGQWESHGRYKVGLLGGLETWSLPSSISRASSPSSSSCVPPYCSSPSPATRLLQSSGRVRAPLHLAQTYVSIRTRITFPLARAALVILPVSVPYSHTSRPSSTAWLLYVIVHSTSIFKISDYLSIGMLQHRRREPRHPVFELLLCRRCKGLQFMRIRI